MAKFSRHDPRNKKRNKHKFQTKSGDSFKRIKEVRKGGKLRLPNNIHYGDTNDSPGETPLD